MREASGIERWVQVKPAMFEDTMDEELGKFERFRNDLNISSERQTELLEQIAV
jgi:programmed cell death 6-interacting protein